MATAEREQWRRRLPAGFQLLLERLGRAVIRDNPPNILEYAAGYIEKKILEDQGWGTIHLSRGTWGFQFNRIVLAYAISFTVTCNSILHCDIS